VLTTLALTLVVLVVLEGVSGGVLFVLDTLAADRTRSALQMNQFDTELGWNQIPNHEVRQLWGPDRSFRSNSRGFRADYDIEAPEPPARARVICSGDSFTFGDGVNAEDTWCQQLGDIDPRIEPVNLGQGGYGVGQSYLWFMRSAEPLEHSVHLLAFITVDFNRMRRGTFRLWVKPKLVLDDGALVIANYPLRRNSRLVSWVETRRRLGKRFNLWRLIKRVEAGLQSENGAASDRSAATGLSSATLPPLPDSASREVASAIFRSLKERNREKGSTLVLVHLPGTGDLGPAGSSPLYESWRRFLADQAARDRLIYIDLVAELRGLSEDERWRMFIHSDVEGYRGAAGHYSAHGNAIVARALYERLIELPPIAARLAELGPHQGANEATREGN
jgi:hypothetical protein